MATRLTDLRVIEVSLVDRPANKKPLLLLRSADTPADQPSLTLPEELLPALRRVADDGSLIALLTAAADEPGKETPMDKCPKCGAELAPGDAEKGECPKCGASLKAEKAADRAVEKKENDMDKAAFEALAKQAADTKAQLETLLKEHADAKAKVEELTKKSSDAEAKLAAEVAERRQRDAVAKTAKCYPSLDQKKVVSQILKAETRGKEDLDELDAILAQAQALAKAGFKEIGSPGESAGADPWAKIEAGAAALVAKAGEKLTREQSIARFLETPEGLVLHREYRATQQ